jgi:hypothetical protein
MGAETLTRPARGFNCVAREAAVLLGGFLEVIVALADIGTAVTLYPVLKRQNEGVALGFAAARVREAGMIFAGVVSLLSLVTLRQHLGGAAVADAAALVPGSHAARRRAGPARPDRNSVGALEARYRQETPAPVGSRGVGGRHQAMSTEGRDTK